MSRTVLITGATGTVSTALLNELGARAPKLRALVRDGSAADGLRARGAEVFTGDLDDAGSLPPAFEGVDDLWLLTPNGPRAPEQSANAVRAAVRAGVERVVRLSAVGAAPDAPNRSGRLHAAADRELQRSGLLWTVLRPHWFMQNLLGEAEDIRATGTFSLDMAAARLGMIDARDLAACAALILLDRPERHHGEAYTLTGPRPLTFDQVAEELGHVLGRTVGYRLVGHDARRRTLLAHGAPGWIADMLEDYARAYAAGWGDLTTGTVTDLLHRPARDIADFLRDHAPAFARQDPSFGDPTWSERDDLGPARRGLPE
ncbi:NAD(P)H-binding protein [Kitasatospora sp. NPDC048365]|uniref:NmrA family NAD(P)-binding protein n=1 Tax=Kitasatospora sp. NPDC048365 TaxID=3364050 RepID=UPI003720FC9C